MDLPNTGDYNSREGPTFSCERVVVMRVSKDTP